MGPYAFLLVVTCLMNRPLEQILNHVSWASVSTRCVPSFSAWMGYCQRVRLPKGVFSPTQLKAVSYRRQQNPILKPIQEFQFKGSPGRSVVYTRNHHVKYVGWKCGEDVIHSQSSKCERNHIATEEASPEGIEPPLPPPQRPPSKVGVDIGGKRKKITSQSTTPTGQITECCSCNSCVTPSGIAFWLGEGEKGRRCWLLGC